MGSRVDTLNLLRGQVVVSGSRLITVLKDTVRSIRLEDRTGKYLCTISPENALGLCAHREYIGFTRRDQVRAMREVSRYELTP